MSQLRGMTPRCQEVLSFMVKGLSAKQMARELGIQSGTVKFYILEVLRIYACTTQYQFLARHVCSTDPSAELWNALTPVEQEVVSALHRGLEDKQIAILLGRNMYTVKVHLKRVYSKLSVKNRTELLLKLYPSPIKDDVTGLPEDVGS